MRLYVGCGGLASRTLLRLAEKLEKDGGVSRWIERQIAFLALDTELTSLEHFKDGMFRLSHSSSWSYSTVHITNGVLTYGEIVDRVFRKATDEKELALLSKHWWMTQSGPYRMREVAGPAFGSGRSASAAYLAMWYALPRLEEAVHEIVDHCKLSDIGSSTKNAEVVIVTGTSGGTGRGCWALAGMKIAQCLERFGFNVCSSGVFFDASCFSGLYSCDELLALDLQAASLLTYSELSAWLKISNREIAYEYSLPELTTLENTEPSIGGVRNGKAPLSNAYVVFGENGMANFSNPSECEEAISEALYVRCVAERIVAAGEAIKASEVNSFAAASFVVDTLSISNFFENGARWSFVKKLIALADSSAGDDLFPRFMSYRNAAVDCVCKSFGWKDGRCPFFEALAEKMRLARRKDIPEIGKILHRSLAFVDCETVIASQVEEVLRELGFADEMIPLAIVDVIMRAFASEGDSLSIGRALSCANALIPILDRIRNEITLGMDSLIPAQTPAQVAEYFINVPYGKVYKSRTLIQMLRGNGFNNEIIKGLYEAFLHCFRMSASLVVRPVLLRKLEIAKRCTLRLRDTIEEQRKALNALAVSSGKDVIATFKDVFDAPEWMPHGKSFPGVAQIGLSRRVLKPILSFSEIDNVLGHDVPQIADDGCFKRVFRGKLLDTINDKRIKNAIDRLNWDRDLWWMTIKNAVPPHYGSLGNRFSFAGVLRGNLSYWNRLLSERVGNFEEYEAFVNSIRENLGVQVPVHKGNPYLDEELVLKGVIRLTCMTCRPWVRLGNEDVLKTSLVCVPCVVPETLRYEMVNEIRELQHGEFTLADLSYKDFEVPRNGIVAYMSVSCGGGIDKSLENIKTLDYWRTPRLMDRLRLAEDPGGAAYFEMSADWRDVHERRGAIGYTSPIFVADEGLASARWRPWMDALVANTLKRQDESERPQDYDVFISYRRAGGCDVARMLCLALQKSEFGYRVFFDFDSLRDGVFNQEIYRAIESAKYFVLVVTDGAFDRCSDESDWVRCEIEYALKLGRTIIPVAPSTVREFAIPSDLPPSIASIASLQISELNMRQLFDASVRQIVESRFNRKVQS